MFELNKYGKSNANNQIDEAKAAGKALAKDPLKGGEEARKERDSYSNALQIKAFDDGFKEGVKEVTSARKHG